MAADRGMGPPRPAEAKRQLARVMKLLKPLPGIEEGTAHGSRDIRAFGKQIGAIRRDADFSLNCITRDAKQFLLETQSDVYWEAPHYVNSSWVIVRMAQASDAQLFKALENAWRARAPKKLLAEYDAKAPAPPKPATKAKTARSVPKAPARAPKDHFARVVKLTSKLPAILVGTSYGTPGIRANKKFLCRMKEDGESLVVLTANLDEKEFLMSVDAAVFYETPHYQGHTGVLVHLAKIDDKRLFNLLEASWKRSAGKKLLAEYEGKSAK